MGYGAYKSSSDNVNSSHQAQPQINGPKNGAMGLVLCAVLGVVAFGVIHAQNKPQGDKSNTPPPPETLHQKIVRMESQLDASVKKSIASAVSDSVVSPSGLDGKTTKAIVIQQIKSAYQQNLTEAEYQKAFTSNYDWDSAKEVFGANWLGSLYTVADGAATKREQELKDGDSPARRHQGGPAVNSDDSGDDTPPHRVRPIRVKSNKAEREPKVDSTVLGG